MKRILILFILVLISVMVSEGALAGTHMNREGTCRGKNLDGQELIIDVFSNYQGCLNVSQASLVFRTGGSQAAESVSGVRSVPKDTLDSYVFVQKDSRHLHTLYQLNVDETSIQAMSRLTIIAIGTHGIGAVSSVEVKCQMQMYQYIPCDEQNGQK